MALWAAVLTVPVYNVVDLSFYVYQKMQVENAAQMAAQAVYSLCTPSMQVPATKSCSGLLTAITTAAQSTSLATAVTVPSGSPTEGYYCVNAANALQLVGTAGTIPSGPTPPSPDDCSTVNGGQIGDYIQVTVSYAYTPAFPGVSIVSLLTTPITHTAWMRLD